MTTDDTTRRENYYRALTGGWSVVSPRWGPPGNPTHITAGRLPPLCLVSDVLNWHNSTVGKCSYFVTTLALRSSFVGHTHHATLTLHDLDPRGDASTTGLRWMLHELISHAGSKEERH
eukprot:3851476-Pyramimonas_sp.AAC.2